MAEEPAMQSGGADSVAWEYAKCKNRHYMRIVEWQWFGDRIGNAFRDH